MAWQLMEKGAGYVCGFVPENYEKRKNLYLTPMCHRDGSPVSRNTWFFYPKSKRLPDIQMDFVRFVECELSLKQELSSKEEEKEL